MVAGMNPIDELDIFGYSTETQDNIALAMILAGVTPFIVTRFGGNVGMSNETRIAFEKYEVPGAALAVAGGLMRSGGSMRYVGYAAGAWAALTLLSPFR